MSTFISKRSIFRELLLMHSGPVAPSVEVIFFSLERSSIGLNQEVDRRVRSPVRDGKQDWKCSGIEEGPEMAF